MAALICRLGRALALGVISLCVLFASQGVVAQAPAAASLDRWQRFIAEASHRFAIPEAWIRAVMRAESGGQAIRDGRPITSSAGAMGLMQFMPQTWVELRDRYGFGGDPYDPRDSILAGAAYLRELHERYGYPNLFAAYNAGPGRLDEHLSAGRPLPDETVAYLEAVGQPTGTPAVGKDARPFLERRQPLPAALRPSSQGLFVPLKTVPGDKR